MNKTFTLRYLLIISYLWYFAEWMLYPLFSLFAQNVGGDILEITSIYAIFLLTLGFLYIIFGKLVDRTESEELMLFLGYLLNTFTTFSLLLVSTIWQLFLIEVMLGISVALSTPSWNSLYTKNMIKGKYAEQWSYVDGGSTIISALALISGGIIISNLGWNILFLIMGSLEAIATILIAIRMNLKQIVKSKFEFF